MSQLSTHSSEVIALLTKATRMLDEDPFALTVVVSDRETVKITAPRFGDSGPSLVVSGSRVPHVIAEVLPPFVDALDVGCPFVVFSVVQLYDTGQAAFVRGCVWVLVQATGVSELVVSIQLLSVEGVDGEPDEDWVVPSPSRSWFSMEYDVTDVVRAMT